MGSQVEEGYYELQINKFDEELNRKFKYPENSLKTSKYTFWNFLPLNLYGQFKRYYNIYFLVSAILGAFKSLNPFSPIFGILPLAIVLTAAALKDALEDIARHHADKSANSRKFQIIRDAGEQTVTSANIKVGDIVKIRKEEKVPADILLLSSSQEDGFCFVETSDLDGETNLKKIEPPEELAIHDLKEFIAKVQCEMPNDKLHSFTGRLILNERTIPVSATNLLLKGSYIKNTDNVYGAVIYSGKDTKISRNLRNHPLKYSTLEPKLNRLVAAVFALNLLILLLSSILGGVYLAQNSPEAGYLFLGENILEKSIEQTGSLFIIFTYLIPLSLFITIEMTRAIQAKFIEWDMNMATEGKYAEVKNSNLHEDLAGVEYIFSDKTGTLTNNLMKVSKWYVTGHPTMDESNNPGSIIEIQVIDINFQRTQVDSPQIEIFRTILAVCNSVLPVSNESGIIQYESESPDEEAILYALKENGISLTKRTKTMINFTWDDKDRQFEIAAILPFTSARKRMTIIIKTDQKYFLYCKGADSTILSLIRNSDTQRISEFEMRVNEFAESGLRTLITAYKEIESNKFIRFKGELDVALTSIENREENISNCFSGIETDLELVGIVAIEDELQEKVPETIKYLLECGIKIWLLTGDKQETAINISHTANLIPPDGKIHKINASKVEDDENLLNNLKKEISGNSEVFHSVVIDGYALEIIFKNHLDQFSSVCGMIDSVVCCRVSPIQKASIVRIVKRNLQKITLSIGDGANDVSMIQAAHIGIGIQGREGGHASRASDYSFAEFRHLKRLLAIHGRYSFLRLSKLIFYSFYKNITMITVQFWFGFQSGFSSSVN